MKELIPKDEYGVFASKDEIVWVDSRYVAKYFEKRHDHVLRDIAKLTAPKSGLSENFVSTNFKATTYKDTTGRTLPCYQLTRDGFTMLVMGFTGAKANGFKEQYIRQFNMMRERLNAYSAAKRQFPRLTAQIQLIHDNPKPYHYSNECDMLNRIAIGMTAKQYKIEHGLDLKCPSIRPYLSAKENERLEYLESIDLGLLVGVASFKERKALLETALVKHEGGLLNG